MGDIAGDRARATARDIAGDAAATIVRAAKAAGGRSAARDAARRALAPTLEALQRSAFALLERMLPTIPVLAGATVPDQDLFAEKRLVATAQ